MINNNKDDQEEKHGAAWYFDIETGELVLGMYADDNWYFDMETGELRMGWIVN